MPTLYPRILKSLLSHHFYSTTNVIPDASRYDESVLYESFAFPSFYDDRANPENKFRGTRPPADRIRNPGDSRYDEPGPSDRTAVPFPWFSRFTGR